MFTLAPGPSELPIARLSKLPSSQLACVLNRWKDPKNRYRQEWNISNIPTIVKMQGVCETLFPTLNVLLIHSPHQGEEIARLGDDNEIEMNLVTFVKS